MPKGKYEVKKVEEEPETISNSLVPIISREEMDSYAPLSEQVFGKTLLKIDRGRKIVKGVAKNKQGVASASQLVFIAIKKAMV